MHDASKRLNKSNNNKVKTTAVRYIKLLPVIAFTAVVLLLIKAESYTMDVGYMPDLSINSDSTLGDFFCLIKADACFYISIWALLTLAYLLITRQFEFKKTKIYIPMAIYTVSVLFSFAFSDYKLISWYGSANRFEGTRTILCYMFMLFYTINVVEDIKDAARVLIPTIVTVFLANIVGLTQLIDHDILFSETAKTLFGNGLDLRAEFDAGQVYQTVYNMNYVGMYLALLIPLLVYFIYKGIMSYRKTSFFFTGKKGIAFSIFLCILLTIIALNVYGAHSMGGVLGICVGIMAMIIAFTQKKEFKLILTVFSFAAFLAVMAIMFLSGRDELVCIDYFETGSGYLKTSIDGDELLIEFDRETKNYFVSDADGKRLSVSTYQGIDGHYQVDDGRFKGKFVLIPVEAYGNSILCFGLYGREFQFKMDGDEVKFINPYHNLVSLGKIESAGFRGHLSAGSGRGYIWSRTIPKLKDHLILGSGADTFMMVFPQNDYAGKYSSGSNLDTLFDKPHNMYLQMFICTGGISCLAFIIMMVIFIYDAMKAGKNNSLLILIASGVCGFLIAGLFNDSIVCIMPLFYGILGVGISQTCKKVL